MADKRTITPGTKRLADALPALAGPRPGDVARVTLPSGRHRALRVLEVTGEPLTSDDAPPEAAVKAA
jgi:hypothetical protein